MRTTILVTQVLLAVIGACIGVASFLWPLGYGIRLTPQDWFVSYCLDGRVRFFYLESEEIPIDVRTPFAAVILVNSAVEAGPPAQGADHPQHEFGRFRIRIPIGHYNRVTSFGGSWRSGASLHVPWRPNNRGRRGVGFFSTFVRVPMWLPVGLLLLGPVRALVASRRQAWRLRRDHRRAERNQCLGCGYDLTGNVSGICSECGMGLGGVQCDTRSGGDQRRKERNQCPGCGNDLTGNVSGVCSECGLGLGYVPER